MNAFLLLGAFSAIGCGASALPPAPQAAAESASMQAPAEVAQPATQGSLPIQITKKAAEEVRKHISDMQRDPDMTGKPLYLRLRVQGGGCTGFQNKLDLDPTFDPAIDTKYEILGIPVVIDKRSLLYVQGATVDFHNEPNKRGFSVTTPPLNPALPPLENPAATVPVVAVKDEEYVTIKGQITWPGAVPKLVPINQRPGMRPAGAPPLMPTDLQIDPKSLGLKNVIVWIRPDSEVRTEAFPADRIKPELVKPKAVNHVLGVVDFQFEPRVFAARAGDTFEFINTTGHAHNLNYSSDDVAGSPLLPQGNNWKLKDPLKAQLAPISFTCNIYPWMAGRMRVFDHPYFAITDKDGKFEIKDAPVGKWRLVYWHELGFHKGRDGILGFPVTVAKPETGTTMELKPLPFEIVVPK